MSLSACLLSGTGNYQEMEDNLSCYVARFDYEREVRPFMTPYRVWNVFVIDTQSMQASQELVCLQALAKTIKSYPTRIVAIWSKFTWERFSKLEPEAAYAANCILCDTPDWVEQLTKALRWQQRMRSNVDSEE